MTILFGAWLDVLGSHAVTDEALQMAVTAYMRTDAQFLPSPGQLYEMIVKAGEQNAEALALQAWQKFRDWDYGHYGDKLDDPLILKAIQAVGGAEYIGNLDSKNVDNYVRREFIKVYQMLKESEQARGGMALPSGATNPRIAATVSETAKKLGAWAK